MVKKRAFFIVIIFLLFIQILQPSADSTLSQKKVFLWNVSSQSTRVYLLGSLHFAPKGLYPLGSTIEDAFHKSDFLVVEVNIVDHNNFEVQNLIMRRARYPQGETLKGHVSDEVYKHTEKAFADVGIPLQDVQIFRPWFSALTLTSIMLQKAGYDPLYGIDYHFLKKAKGNNKKILELESLTEQIELFDKFTDKEQEMLLLYTIKNMANLQKEADKMFTAWKTGNGRALNSLLTKSFDETPDLMPLYAILFTERNKKMLLQIKEFLTTDKQYFVVVGAGHLVGEQGLVNILKKDGYQVQQMD